MTQHIMTNGIEINGTTGIVAMTAGMSTVVAAHGLSLNVRTDSERSLSESFASERCREDHRPCEIQAAAYCDSGKRLFKPSSAPKLPTLKRELPLSASQQLTCEQLCSQGQNALANWQGEVFRNAGELPAAAWASFVISRNDSYCSVSL